MELSERYSMRERFLHYMLGDSLKPDLLVKNVGRSIQYIGMTHTTGRILCLTPNINIRADSLLAHTPSIYLAKANTCLSAKYVTGVVFDDRVNPVIKYNEVQKIVDGGGL